MKLGDTIKDTITGFAGVCTSRHEYLNGCVRLTLQPREIKDGKPVDCQTFDIEQLALVKSAAPKQVTPSGGPHDEPKRADIPARS
jgi:hypothetical protein